MQIGFIGLGTMGLPMAHNLVKKSNFKVKGYDPIEHQRAMFQKYGGEALIKVEDLYQSCEVIFLCLPTNELVESMVTAIIENGRSGTVIVDLSSTSPSLIRCLYQKVKEKDMSLLDAPVSGGEIGAIQGTLAIMCGGDKEVFEKILPILECMGNKDGIALMGESGCGDIAKLANNMIAACNIASMAEAFTYASKAGLNARDFFNVIKNGFAGSTVMTNKAPKMLNHDYKPSARLNIHYKDVKNAMEFAESMNVETPMTRMVFSFMNDLMEEGHASDDHAVLLKWYEDRIGIQI